MYKVKQTLKKSALLRATNQSLKKRKQQKRMSGKYQFADRGTGAEKVCVILAGYKEFLWEKTMTRIKDNVPNDVDVVVVSSGLHSAVLNDICEDNGWSYLSTSKNSVTSALNIAFNIHKNAKIFYKIDEDVFITKHFFNTLLKTYTDVVENGQYDVGFIAPLIPINAYGHVRVLEKLDMKDYYEENFEKVKYISGSHRKIENDPEVAKFFWGENGLIDTIDNLDEKFNKQPFEYRACPIRFSIGAILMPRKVWVDMGGFTVDSTPGMGIDEIELCSQSMISSKAIIVSENTLVGHLSFGSQNKPMESYFLANKDKF